MNMSRSFAIAGASILSVIGLGAGTAAAGTGQLAADELPQRWQEEYRSPHW